MRSRIFLSKSKVVLFAFLVLAFLSPLLTAEEGRTGIVVGEKLTIESKILGEERVLMIYPPDLEKLKEEKLPVLYLLDGAGHYHHVTGLVQFLSRNRLIPRMIVVAIPNTDRTRDLSPTVAKNRPGSGGGANFLAFFKKELIPYIDKNYPTLPYRILVGHSLGGLFTVHTFLVEPDLFDGYIALSPWLIYNEGAVLKRAEAILPRKKELNKSLYLTLGDEGEKILEALNKFTGILEKSKIKGLEWSFDLMEAEDHGSIPHRGIYRGLEMIYSDWRLPRDISTLGVEGVKKHYLEISEKYGYEIAVPEGVLNLLGYQYMNKKEMEKAIKVFKENVKLFPDSANVHDSLGEALEKSGRLKLAKKQYALAVKIGKKIEDPNLGVYRANYERVSSSSEKKVKEKMEQDTKRREVH